MENKKEKLDERADVWATVTRWLTGLLLSSGLVYLIYWSIKNIQWIVENWTRFEIGLSIFGVVVLVSPIIFFLFKKTKVSEETTVNFIEAKIEKYLYWKHKFDIEKYFSVLREIQQKESEIKNLTQ